MGPQLSTTGIMGEPKQPSPLSIRIEQDLDARLESFASKIDKKKHAVATAAMRLGMQILEKDQSQFFDALIAAEKAKAEAAQKALEEEKLKAATPLAKSEPSAKKEAAKEASPKATPQPKAPTSKGPNSKTKK